jgi:hypothetical protein
MRKRWRGRASANPRETVIEPEAHCAVAAEQPVDGGGVGVPGRHRPGWEQTLGDVPCDVARLPIVAKDLGQRAVGGLPPRNKSLHDRRAMIERGDVAAARPFDAMIARPGLLAAARRPVDYADARIGGGEVSSVQASPTTISSQSGRLCRMTEPMEAAARIDCRWP